MRDLKMRNLLISLSYSYLRTFQISPGEPGEKMMDDLRKLLKSSHNFSTLYLEANIREESGFPLLSTIFHELGEKLVELTMEDYIPFFPEEAPPFPLMSNLKKFTHYGSGLGSGGKKLKWASLLASLLSNNLEDFTCGSYMAETYLQTFLNRDIDMPKLRGIAIKGEYYGVGEEILSPLFALKNVLTSLEIHVYSYFSYSEPEDGDQVQLLLEKLLLKHSQSLQTLVLRMRGIAEIQFPSFPKLEELSLAYVEGTWPTRIKWEKSFTYKSQFPLLKKLAIMPGVWIAKEDPVFDTFFPEERDLTCETVTDWSITVDQGWNSPLIRDYFQRRRNKVEAMFPKALNKFFGYD